EVYTQVGQEDAKASERLGQQQLHRAAVKLSGHGAGGPADGPQTENGNDQWVDIADRQHVAQPENTDSLAPDQGPGDLAGPLEEEFLDIGRPHTSAARHPQELR